MKQRVSKNVRWSRFLFLGIGVVLVFVIIYSLTKTPVNTESIAIEVLFSLFCYGLYSLFDKAKTVEFDAKFMYVFGKSDEQKIPLKNIYKIKMTLTEVNDRNIWKIGYYDTKGIKKSVRILPRWFGGYFNNFKERVKSENKLVKIKNWSHSLDFDQ